jgi:hypothetical protein
VHRTTILCAPFRTSSFTTRELFLASATSFTTRDRLLASADGTR